ncbi:methyltransferase [Bradyrhizobium valentinum]|uniref:methyltransferase n=1 Tax=Bradyrhizobium valentinum TaxID=1518501 RepID=UPI00070A87F3
MMNSGSPLDELLGNVRKAMNPAGRLLLVDGAALGRRRIQRKWPDMTMLVSMGGQERTEVETFSCCSAPKHRTI